MHVKTKILKFIAQVNPYLVICCLKLKLELSQAASQKERLILNILLAKKTRGLYNSFPNYKLENWSSFTYFGTFRMKRKIKYFTTFSYSHLLYAGTHVDYAAEQSRI